jgi:hypothetical protein
MNRLLPVFGGATSGLVVALVVVGGRSPGPRTASAGLREPLARDNQALEERTRVQLVERSSPAASCAAPANANPPGSASPKDERDQDVIEMQEHGELVTAVRQESRDVEWAPQMESNIRRGLEELGEKSSFKIRGVDCRTSSCTIDFSWPTHQKAQQELTAIVTESWKAIPCIRRLTLPPEGQSGSAYEATMIADCSEVRWGPAEAPVRK